MAENHNNNRRKHPRADIRYAMSVNLEQRRLRVRTADLGYGGALIGSLVVANAGSFVTLELRNEAGGGECGARVLRHYRNGFAVEFIDPSAAFTDALTAALAPQLGLSTVPPRSAQIIQVDFRRKAIIP